jgi:hypothetical protein
MIIRSKSSFPGVVAPAADWTPAQPTTNGGVSPLVWEVPGVANFQDTAKTTPAGVGDVVGAVENQGSDSHDLTQGTAASKPTLQQVTINSVTSVIWRLDGTDDFLRVAAFAGAIAQPYTAFAVAKLSATANVFRQVTDGPGLSSRVGMYQRNTTAWAITCGTELIDGASDTNWNIWTLLANGASSQFWHNGISKASGNAGTQSLTGLVVGANTNGSGGYWIGDIGQILVYPGDLSLADKNQVNDYLERVTGISVTAIT